MGNREYKTSEEVRQRAEEAIGHSFKKIFELAKKFQQENGLEEKHGKGAIGQSYEEGWFNYACNREDEPDFKEADIELKVTPFLINSRGYRAKERLSLGKINYKDENWNEYKKSRFWTKNHHLLVMYYQYIKGVKREDFSVKKIDEILLEKLPERDQMIIQHDWEKIARYVKEGKAHKLSERDFMYLSPARKGSGGDEKVKYDDRYPKAKPRAYSFKKSYMTKLFNERMISTEEIFCILPDIALPKEKEFDDILLEILKKYLGRTVDSLKKEFSNYRNGYRDKNDIIKQIYNSECELEETDEFQKANYKLRTITIDENGTPTQDMSFSVFDFDALLKEKSWTESIVYDEMVDSKFLLVIFSKNAAGKEVLNNAMIWYIPKKDENKVKEVWKETRKVIKNGIKLQQKLSHDKEGQLIFVYENNFPKSDFNKVAHVRNKAGESEYFCENGNSVRLKKPAEVITLKEIPKELKDVPIPTGKYITKQCFWFNKKYMKQQIKNFIKSY
ncbi:Sau3AI family type II restriction endonuclease [Velocimicrobium porci]|uniref:Restriction endonuclease n=1 Tax=Velocimicrobium porci TaxID=2606634 RepID=A0A6L5XUX2_9FIRM|nr:Sau3AI family type II restriction endonuclease [Velocimicrobium porci]MSS62404.1 restriction endonuclease [Velocimicrobium porci]